MLRDSYSRPATHVRISVTNRCNYSCVFCHREGFSYSSNELRPEDWAFFTDVAVRLGFKYYKLTGGEPLLYEGVDRVVGYIRERGGIPSITTNGYLLREFARRLSEAGVDHVNVSLHSLKPEVYSLIAGVNALNRVISGIREALDYGIRLKINYLVLKYNIGELADVLNLASKLGVDVNLIELIPLGMDRRVFDDLHVELEAVEREVRSLAIDTGVEEFQNRVVYRLRTGIRVYVIKGYGNYLLCAGCTRVRVGPDGRMKLCLYRDDIYVDLGPAIISRDRAELERLIRLGVSLREPYFRKP
jgi:cyclic pyranopterin phosphate synthase